MTNAMGPTFAGGDQPFANGDYRLLFLPDINNDQLQREGKAPVFYWVPGAVHLARKDGPAAGDYLFNFIRFAGVQDADTTVGAEGHREVAGGLLTFTTTGAPPDDVLEAAKKDLTARFSANADFFWGIRAGQPPMFRPAIITSNTTAISNVSPTPTKGVPGLVTARSGPGGVQSQTVGTRELRGPTRSMPLTMRDGPVADNNLDPWYWQMQGQGAGSIDAGGQNAFSGLIGAYPAAILWAGFHGTSAPITVTQALKLKVWSPIVEIRIHGSWSRIFDHFSAAAHANYLWASVDIQAEFNSLRISGDIEVDVKVDQTLPGADKIAEQLDKRTDMVFNKFMDEANKVIFEPPQPQVEPAHASSGGGWWSASVALKVRHDETKVDLDYHETRQFAYLQDHVISSSLAGMADEIKGNADLEKKYFMTVTLDDWPRKIHRLIKPIVNWDAQPVAMLSAQIGYPNTQGAIDWQGHAFQASGGPSDVWDIGLTQKEQTDVSSPPAGWEPDKTFVKRKVHFTEGYDPLKDPYNVVQIDQNVVDLDPEPNGVALNDVTLEVRADSAGRLAVGPIGISGVLADATQMVEAIFDVTDANGTSLGREQVRHSWTFADQDKPRTWSIYTGDPEFRPYYRYQVRVIIKGTLFAKGKDWTGPWVAASGNGPITLTIPMETDPGVTTRELPLFVMDANGRSSRAMASAATSPSKGTAGKPAAVAPASASTGTAAPSAMPYSTAATRGGPPSGSDWTAGPVTGGGAMTKDVPSSVRGWSADAGSESSMPRGWDGGDAGSADAGATRDGPPLETAGWQVR